MDQQHDATQLPPAEWIEALERGRADAAAGRTVPAEPFLTKLEATLKARIAKKATDAV